MLRIKVFPKSQDGCSFYRLEQPARFIPEMELDWTIAQKREVQGLDVGDINLFQRVAEPLTLEIMERLKEQGHPIWIEQDDNFRVISQLNPLINLWPHDKILRNEYAFKLVDGATVSTNAMQKEYKVFQNNIHAINNYVDLSLFPDLQDFEKDKKMREEQDVTVVGYAGSWNHHIEIAYFSDIFKQLSQEPKVAVVFIGFDPKQYAPQKFDFPYHFIPWSNDAPSYYRQLLNVDIGLAICLDTQFNRYKTDLKFIEYAAGAIPCVAIGPCYTETVKSGENGFLAKHEGDMLRKILKLVKDREKRRAMGNEARKYVVEKRQMQNNIWRWRKALGLD